MSREVTGYAHGRVNLIGEHTDYNGGFVLPTVIPQRTEVHARARGDDVIKIHSESLGAFRYRLGEEKPSGHWADYVAGATRLLAQLGRPIGGMDLEIRSGVPIGSGLSSSAALNLAFLRAARELFGFMLPDREAAALCTRIENEFVGARVGVMDPLACALASPGQALFLDTRSLETENIPLPAGAALVVVHSGVSHRNAAGDGYNVRRSECEAAAAELGVSSLRDLDPTRLGEHERRLPPVVFRRVRHVLTENERVRACVRAFRAGDLAAAGELFGASHASLRDDYEVSVPEVDCLVACLARQPGVFGARITGGGFGGSVVALAEADRAVSAGEDAAKEYAGKTGRKPVLLVP